MLARQIAHHHPQPHRFICVTDFPATDFPACVEVVAMPAAARALLPLGNPAGPKFPASYPRLWTFSKEARELLGDRVMLVDVDCMFVDRPAPLLEHRADFVGWRVRPPAGGPRRFGGGTWLHSPGTRTHVWERFIADPGRAIATALAAGYRGSDQAWISYCLSECEASWPEPSGIFCAQDYRKDWLRAQKPPAPIYRRRRRAPPPQPVSQPGPLKVPAGAIILHMNGESKPWDSDDAVIRKHWRPFVC